MITSLENTDKKGVSIVIVTYNGVGRLQPTLVHIADQKHIDFPCELLLIDNNSTDGTSSFVKETWETLGAPLALRIEVEKQSGTMFARQRGIDSSNYRYMVFCDDDNLLNPNYIRQAYDRIKSNEKIAAVGGQGIIEYNGSSASKWMTPAFERNYGCGPQGKSDGDTTYDKGCLYTAGAILDRQWLSKLYSAGFRSVLKGRDSKSLVAGEDTELTMALKLIGAELHYYSELSFKHVMTPQRITWAYLKRLHEGFGYSNHILSPYKHVMHNKRPSRKQQLLKTVKDICALELSLCFKTNKEGNVEVLHLQSLKGRLRAMLFGQAKYRESLSIAKKLSKNHLK
ncbi:glycosyltransferase [Winogradskyella sp. A3E31]|uniref:glycosyltransferase n=1 Tax=Winogradskyella sp. A3E31 TaxID=3349637 RepID=UPI00398AECDB